jgi:hypothetical protein
MNAHLDRLAGRLQSDPFFLAAPLACYAESQKVDDAALAGRIGCDLDTLTRLRLCRNPDPLPPRFWQEVECIAVRIHLDADRLAEIVRFGQALLQAQAPDRTDNQGAGFLMAARDETDGEPAPGDNS